MKEDSRPAPAVVSADTDGDTDAHHVPVSTRRLAGLTLAALGVVYGDIGTSPLYAMKECFVKPHGVEVNAANIFGILSLVFWSITFVIGVKYLVFVMRADNRGEGGVLALLSLVIPREATEPVRGGKRVLLLLGLFGAALLYGDGMITPAISVLSAIEGLEVATPVFDHFVMPITVVILIALFAVQKHGTARVGSIFGPATLVWFASIALSGAVWIAREPSVLGAVDPRHAVRFFLANGRQGFLVLGAVVLCITGGEALYADMGHFGKRAIRIGWYAVVFPALLLNYFGQGAILLRDPAAAANPFYAMVPGALLYPMVVIATAATVVASQALISGAYSLTRQAVQLGYSPRITIVHTSGAEEGQIYVPEINNILMVSCIALVFAFQRSTNLAAAYGIAVTGTMAITSLLFYAFTRIRWGWSRLKAGSLLALFLCFDIAYLGANLAKVTHGGWVPLVVASVIFSVMTTWKWGRARLGETFQTMTLPLDDFLEDVKTSGIARVPGTAVFLTPNPRGTPQVLLHHVKHNKVLHRQVVLLSILTDRSPLVRERDRLEVRTLTCGFYQVIARYGFMETPSVPRMLQRCPRFGLTVEPGDTSYYLGRETLLPDPRARGLAKLRRVVFAFLSRNARPATAFFGLPPNRVVEMGAQIEF